ncbi:putative metallopeptidase [Sphingobium yanoikuyae]|uniref:putative metallopeptidase n=1 Tax=Sphingobium yanoikuyae TaxID=13690 RepID=UPI0035C6E434
MIPRPPVHLLETFAPAFVADPSLETWVRDTILFPGGALENPDHVHLQSADIGYLWTNVENARSGRRIIGQARLLPPAGEKWSAGMASAHILAMFERMPDFLIILDAMKAAEMEDWEVCALIEHELYHCAQKKDEFGEPMFHKETGQPLWAMRGHDVEEFVGVVRRYGVTSPELAAMVQAVNRGASVAATQIARACGTCLRVAK